MAKTPPGLSQGRYMRSVSVGVCTIVAIVAMGSGVSRPAFAQSNVLERWFGPPKGEQRTVRQPKQKRAASPSTPPIAAIPVPDQRPERPDEALDGVAEDGAGAATSKPGVDAPAAEAAKPLDRPSAKTDATAADLDAAAGDALGGAGAPDSPKPLPEPRPEGPSAADALPDAADEPRSDDPRSGTAPVDSKESGSTTVEPGPPENTPNVSQPETGTVEVPADPRATAEKPVEEIPVPVQRPAEPMRTEGAAATPAAPAATREAEPTASDSQAEDAPNSTDRLKARIPTISPAETVLAAAAIEDAESCEAELKRRGVEFTVSESVSEGECGVLRPVNVTILSSGVTVSPKTQMLCRTALALDDWMTASVVPAAKADLPAQKLTEFRHASTYVCRPRASERGISEHARGSAIDIAAFVFDEGKQSGSKEIGIAAQAAGTPEARFQETVRAAACGPFKTVLGPGTDADHATHFHLDIAARRNGSTYCK